MGSHLVLSPLTWGLLLGALLALFGRRLARPWRSLSIIALLAILVLWTPLGANLLVRVVEAGIGDRDRCSEDDHGPLVVLSGGLAWRPRDAGDFSALQPESWRRLSHAVREWRRDRVDTLVIVGGGPYPVKESMVLAELAREWGVPSQALRVESGSTTTWEGAFALRGHSRRDIRLVSSSLHLPRAMLSYRAAGFRPCADPSGSDYVPPDSVGYFLPQTSALSKSERAIHEWVGTLRYRLRAASVAPGAEARDAG